MMACPTCGLPIALCNAIASYHLAVERFKKGRTDSAADFADDAASYYATWRESVPFMGDAPKIRPLDPAKAEN